MAGLLSSLFDSSSASQSDSAPESNDAVVYVSPDDNFDDNDGGTQGTQSFQPSYNDPNDGGAADNGPLGPPSGQPEPQSGEADAGGF